MNCNCDTPARYLISREGKPCFTCGSGRCRFFALAPTACDGYTRVTLGAPGGPPADTGVVIRFEALVHPDDGQTICFMVRVQGDAQLWGELRTAVLQDPQYEGAWYTTAKAFLYPMAHYSRLLQAIKARSMPHTALEEIPSFYFRCGERLRQVTQRYEEDVAAGRARLPDTEDCVFRQLKPFQREGVRFVISHNGRAMIADDMGLGKTVQAIAVAHHYRDEWPVLVVCPMSLLENWAKEFNRFCGIPYTRIAILQGTKATATSLQDIVIVSYSSLKCVEQAHFMVVILDESHYIKAGAAKRAQISLKICRDSRRVVLLSGTPAMSRPIELYAQLQAIQPTIIPSRAQFGARYCNAFVSRFGIDMTGHSHTDELHSLLRHYVIRRTKKELSGELPSKSRQLLYVYITDKEKKALEKQILALRRSLTSASSSSTIGSANTSSGGSGNGWGSDLAARAPNAFELKSATARAKVPAVQDYVSGVVEQLLDSGEKIILFAHHQCMMEALKAAVEAVRPRQPIDYIFISGDTPTAQREPAAEHFRTEPTCTVAILSMQSSGTGHNFTCASTVVFTELDWNPSTHLQCEDRVHRIGQSQPCHIKYLLAEGTSDSVIWPLLQAKLSVTTAMFDSTSTAAAARLHDGANKQNVVRRDVVSLAGTGVTATCTPSSSQQSTLDRFLPPPPSSQLSNSPPRLSLQSHSQSQRQSVALPAEGEGGESLGKQALMTPASPSQGVSESRTGTPLSLRRICSAGAAEAEEEVQQTVATVRVGPAAATELVVPFSEMGKNATEVPTRPQQRGSTGGPAGVPGASSRRGAAGTVIGSGARHTAGRDAPSAATAAVPTSVLDLMRQTSTAKPASGSPFVVDLTESRTEQYTREAAPAPVHTPRPSPAPPSSTSSLPVPHVSLASAAGGGRGAAAAPRRTVFTLSSPSPVTPAPSPPSLESYVNGEVSLHDVSAVAAPTLAASPPAATVPLVAAAAPAPSTASFTAVGPVRIPLRTTLHFKRPRSDVDRDGTHLAPTVVPPRPTPTAAAAAASSPPPTAAVVAPMWSPPHPAIPVPSGGAAVPRRTVFRLTTNAGPAQPCGKDSA